MSWVKTAQLGGCFFAWFFLNVMYNITNKKCQNAFPMPWTMTVVSLFVGAPPYPANSFKAPAPAQAARGSAPRCRSGRARARPVSAPPPLALLSAPPLPSRLH